MIKDAVAGVLLAGFFAVSGPAFAAGQTRLAAGNSAPAPAAKKDCYDRIQALDESNTEGEERLNEKYEVIEACDGQYAHDATINRLVDTCTKYEEQPVLKQQYLADCQLAAYRYANALRDLKEQYKK